MDMFQRALELSSHATLWARQCNDPPDNDAPTVCEKPEWTTPNHEMLVLTALRLRDFSLAGNGCCPVDVVAPFALHDAALADLAPAHSLIETLRTNGCSRLFLVEWMSATMQTQLHTIDSHLAELNIAVDDVGAPVALIGLCQGGWLSLIYATRFPDKVRKLVLAGAPVRHGGGDVGLVGTLQSHERHHDQRADPSWRGPRTGTIYGHDLAART